MWAEKATDSASISLIFGNGYVEAFSRLYQVLFILSEASKSHGEDHFTY